MKWELDDDFIKKLKKLDVRIRNNFKKKIEVFEKNPYDASLKNHILDKSWKGYRSINVGDYKNDYRAIYKELHEDKNNPIAYFVTIDTHKNLYSKEVEIIKK